jgi:hypothetical protein
MQNLPEGLIYVLVLAVAYLANYLFKRFGPRIEPVPPQADLDEGELAQEPFPVGPAAAWIAPATALPAPRLAAGKSLLPGHPRGPFARRALMGSRQSRQAAIAMATILGPCKAFEPARNQASPGI